MPARTWAFTRSDQRRTRGAETVPPDAAEPGQRPRSLRWFLALAGIVLLAANLRAAVTSVPPLLGRMSADLALTPAVIGLLGALPPLAFALAGLLGVRLLRRCTAEAVVAGLLVTIVAGELTRPFVPWVPGFLAISAVTLLALGVGNIVLPPLVKAWFPSRVGPVTAGYVSMIAIGTALPAYLAVPVADHAGGAGGTGGAGWRVGLAVWGVGALAVLPLWAALARTPRTRPTRASGQTIPVHRSPLAWGLALLFATNAVNLYTMFTWLPTRLVDAGLSDAAAGAQLAVFAGVGIVPSLLLPPVLARYGRAGAVIAGCAACFAAGYAGLLLSPLHGTAVWSGLAGLGGGTFPVALTLFSLRSATAATAAAVSGFAQAIGYLGGSAGPLAFGLLHDVSHGWTASFGFLGAVLVLMLVAGRICAAPRTVDDDLTTADTLRG